MFGCLLVLFGFRFWDISGFDVLVRPPVMIFGACQYTCIYIYIYIYSVSILAQGTVLPNVWPKSYQGVGRLSFSSLVGVYH